MALPLQMQSLKGYNMNYRNVLDELKTKHNIGCLKVEELYQDEVYVWVESKDWRATADFLHKKLRAPVSMLFARDRRSCSEGFVLYCGFMSVLLKKWLFVCVSIDADNPCFDSLSGSVFSASLFEREIREMFGIEPIGNADIRCMHLHEEVWPAGQYPLRKDFKAALDPSPSPLHYGFTRGEGEGIFEVPVGPVHAGIIGPGHFHFSVAGEPIINLEIRLGFSHRGVEKLFEGKNNNAVTLAECVAGDSAIAHSLAFCQALEKIYKSAVPLRARYIRAICLELERMYNHVSDIGGIAVDVGFSFPSAQASLIKEKIQSLNQMMFGHRFLKGVLCCGGVLKDVDDDKIKLLVKTLKTIKTDFEELSGILNSSVSFMDRVDTTGVLKRKTAEDLGVSGVAARASGLYSDLRKDFSDIYEIARFKIAHETSGDVLGRVRVRFFEFAESIRLIHEFVHNLPASGIRSEAVSLQQGFALGYGEGWRGPVLYWIATNADGSIDRCKIVDPSFQNWQGLAYCVLGDIIPDFPVCNKSFDLSYGGNDL
jgi:Ni,Fe-hydrogenase III large subunit/Ni,Fe-hydrogenase III component G